MDIAAPPCPSASAAINHTAGVGGRPFMRHKMGMMMHMSFYWGYKAEVLFEHWPGANMKMYIVSLVAVFVAALVVEGLSYSRFLKVGSRGPGPTVFRTMLYTVRSGLSYMVMLAVMCFNVGILLAAVAGHGVGFLVFGSSGKPSDIPAPQCAC